MFMVNLLVVALLTLLPSPEAVVAVPDSMTPMPIPADNPLTAARIELGRHLFYDPALSADGKTTCATCHQQRFAFADNRATSDSSRASARNSMPLFNLAWRERFFWDGRATTLEAAVADALENELEPEPARAVARVAHIPRYAPLFTAAFGDPAVSQTRIVHALAGFLRSIVSFDARIDRAVRGEEQLSPTEALGMKLMSIALPRGAAYARADFCNACHRARSGLVATQRGGSAGLFGTDDPKRNGLEVRGPGDDAPTIVPTVRNISYTAPYMHDGRLRTLEDVVLHYDQQVRAHAGPELLADGRPIRLGFDEKERAAVVAVLKLFDDPSLLTNPAWSDPFD